MRHLLLVAILALTSGLTACSSKTVVKPVPQNPVEVNGIPYALPKTLVDAEVTVTRTQESPGTYRGYTACFFPELTASDLVNQVTYDKSISYKVTDANFSTRGIPDQDEVFVIALNSGFLRKLTMSAQLSEDGILTKSQVEVKNETVAFTVSTLKTLATIAGDVLSVSAPKLKAELAPSDSVDITNSLSSCSATLTQVLKDIESVKADPKVIKAAHRDIETALKEIDGLLAQLGPTTNRLRTLENQPVPKKDDRAAAQAKADELIRLKQESARQQIQYLTTKYAGAALTFQKLSNLQEQRRQTIASFPSESVSVDVLKELTSEFNQAESNLLSFFMGSETVDTWVPTFEPTAPSASLTVGPDGNPRDASFTDLLFKYLSDGDSSDNSGICLSPEFSSTKIPDKFVAKRSTCSQKTGFTEINIALKATNSEQVARRFTSSQHSGDRSYYFRIPARANATITGCDKDGCSDLFPPNAVLIAQWGVLGSLPADTGGSRTNYSVELAATTGALTNFILDADSKLNNVDLSGLETGTKSITDQLAARRTTKLQKLTNDEQVLEQQCKINAIKKVSDPTLDCSSVLNKQ
jgi:hypothetical protein